MNVRIFIESTWNGPARRDGVAMWLIEYIKDGEPITRQGFVHAKACTEAAGCLMAIINTFSILNRPCDTEIYVQCNKIIGAINNGWLLMWHKNDWKKANGEAVANKELWAMFKDKAAPHTYKVANGHHEYQNLMQAAVQKELKEWRMRE